MKVPSKDFEHFSGKGWVLFCPLQALCLKPNSRIRVSRAPRRQGVEKRMQELSCSILLQQLCLFRSLMGVTTTYLQHFVFLFFFAPDCLLLLVDHAAANICNTTKQQRSSVAMHIATQHCYIRFFVIGTKFGIKELFIIQGRNIRILLRH